MKCLRCLLYSLYFLLPFVGLRAAEVPFISGEEYQIRCLKWPGGCIIPSPDDNRAVRYSPAATDDGWFTITQKSDGVFIIRHKKSGRYFTYDGQRTTDRRYMYLSTTDHGTSTRWHIYAAGNGMGIHSMFNSRHFLDVRTQSFIVGTYTQMGQTLTDNERFFLVNKRGLVVTEFGGNIVNLPDACFKSRSKKTAVSPGTVTVVTPVSSMHTKVSPQRATTMPQFAQTPVTGRLSFKIDGRQPVYDSRTKTYLVSVSLKEARGGYSGKVTVEDAGKKAQVLIDGQRLGRNGNFRFDNPENGRLFKLTLTDEAGTVTAAAQFSFTFLPIIELTSGNLTKSVFSAGTFALHDPAGREETSALKAKLRYRGDYSYMMSKKSFSVKLVDDNGKKFNHSFLGLREDNYWVLDALAVDPARMRNRVGMDLWNDMGTKPYYAASGGLQVYTGVRGRLVEVFFNGKYHGVYNFTEHVDRKQLQLGVSKDGKVRGCLYKSRQWDTWTLLGANRSSGQSVGQRPPAFDNSRGTWANWEAKYPEADKGEQAWWVPLYEAVVLTASAGDKEFCRQVGEKFDLPVVRDYYLFIELLHATDNSGKNMYWAVCDQNVSGKLTPVPWDLDGTFGRNWGGHRSNSRANNDYRKYLISEYKQNALFERLRILNPDNWNKRLAQRYHELRRSCFDPDKLYRRFADYADLMCISGAAAREKQRWDGSGGIHLNLDAETEYLKNWLKQRVEFLDRQYQYK